MSAWLLPSGRGESVLIEKQAQFKRELGFRDLTLLLLVAVVGPNIVPAVAGPIVLIIWILVAVLFLLPQAIAVIELSKRFPGEGGLYVWARDILGEFHGFLVGWWYMTVNFVFIPTTLYHLVGYASFIGGDVTRPLADNPLFAAAVTLAIPMVAGVVGLIMTAMGIVLAFVPPGDVVDVWTFELKMLLGCSVFAIPALLIFKHHISRSEV